MGRRDGGRKRPRCEHSEYPRVRWAGGRVRTEGADSRSAGQKDGGREGRSKAWKKATDGGLQLTPTPPPVKRGERKRARDRERRLDFLVPSCKAFLRRSEVDLQRTPPTIACGCPPALHVANVFDPCRRPFAADLRGSAAGVGLAAIPSFGLLAACMSTHCLLGACTQTPGRGHELHVSQPAGSSDWSAPDRRTSV